MSTKRDFTQVAHSVVQQAVGAAAKPSLSAKQQAGRKGGPVSGKNRMAALTDEQRTALALKSVAGRKKAPVVDAGAKFTK